MYHMTEKNIDQLLDVLFLVAVVDVLHGGQHVHEVPKTIPEVPKPIHIRFIGM